MEGKDLFFLQARLTNLFRISFCQVFTSREFKCCGAVGGLSYAPEILKGYHCGSESELRQSSSFDTRSLGKKGPCVAETEIGEGNTCQWVWMAQHSKGGVISIYFLHFEGSTWTLDTGAKVVGSLDRNTTIGFYFDIANQQVPSLLEWGMGKYSYGKQTMMGRLSRKKRLCILTALTQGSSQRCPSLVFRFCIVLDRLIRYRRGSKPFCSP